MTPDRRTFTAHLLIILIAVPLSACLPPSSTSGPDQGRDVLSQEEIQTASPSGSALDLIRSLRPTWLQRNRSTRGLQRGSSTRGDLPNFYLDGMEQSVSDMQNVAATAVQRAIFFSAREAQNRFGSGNENGAILIVTQ